MAAGLVVLRRPPRRATGAASAAGRRAPRDPGVSVSRTRSPSAGSARTNSAVTSSSTASGPTQAARTRSRQGLDAVAWRPTWRRAGGSGRWSMRLVAALDEPVGVERQRRAGREVDARSPADSQSSAMPSAGQPPSSSRAAEPGSASAGGGWPALTTRRRPRSGSTIA